MSADGSVEIQVSADGAEGAADDLADASETGVTGGGGEGGLSQNLRGGIIGGALVSALGPLLDVLNPILDLLKAFLAPLAVMLLRLFQPVLRQFLKLLPGWFDFVRTATDVLVAVDKWLRNNDLDDFIGLMFGFFRDLGQRFWESVGRLLPSLDTLKRDITSELANIPSAIWSLFSDGWDWLSDGAWNIAKDVWSFVSRLPQKIGEEIAQRVPGVPSGEDVVDTGTDLVEDFERRFGGQTTINFSGGLEAFVEQVEENPSIDLP